MSTDSPDDLTRGNGDLRREIAERKQSHDEMDRFFTLSLDMMCIANGDGFFLRVNPAFTQTLGWSRDELLARPFIEFVHPDDRSATLREVDRLVIDRQPVLQFENRYQHKDGSWRSLSWKAISEPGGIIYGTARDVTESRMAEERLRQASEKLIVANKELKAFSYSVSHDLRAPLRHIDGFAGLLRKHIDAGLDENSLRYLNLISKATKHMRTLIDNLIQFSQISRAEMRPLPVQLDSLVHDVLTDLQQEIEGRKIDWVIKDLPQVWADAALIYQVFANLLSNAVKYTRNRETARIEIGSMEWNPAIQDQSEEERGTVQDEIVIYVKDNGVGFDHQYTQKLFNVFQRLHNVNEFEGTGIGLANVKRIIVRHGGRVWAEGKIGEGATFYFSLCQNLRKS